MSASTSGMRLDRTFTGILVILLAAALQINDSANQPSAASPPPLDVPYVPTPPEVVDRMLEMAQVTPQDKLIDLGSGDGRIVITAVKDWDVGSAQGIDLDPERVAEARANAREAGVADRVSFKEGDLFEMDLSEATVVTMYLLQSVNRRLRPVILDTMAPGTRIVSHAFDMDEWTPDQRETVKGRQVFLWIVPAKVGGRWEMTTDAGTQMTLFLNQNHQEFEGNAVTEGASIPLTDTRLQGDEIRFTIDQQTFRGRVKGDRMVATGQDNAGNWHAQR